MITVHQLEQTFVRSIRSVIALLVPTWDTMKTKMLVTPTEVILKREVGIYAPTIIRYEEQHYSYAEFVGALDLPVVFLDDLRIKLLDDWHILITIITSIGGQ